jgi:hypothetical protein
MGNTLFNTWINAQSYGQGVVRTNVSGLAVDTRIAGCIFSAVTSPAGYWDAGQEPIAKYGFGGVGLIWKPGSGLWAQRYTTASATSTAYTSPAVQPAVLSEVKLDRPEVNAAASVAWDFLGWDVPGGVSSRNAIVVYVNVPGSDWFRWWLTLTELVAF